MAREGYDEEYQCKQELIKEYGKENVIKVAIAQFGGDFIVLEAGSPQILKVVEVKGCHAKKFYLGKRGRKQIERITEFCKSHQIGFELWIKYPRKPFEITKYV